MRPGQDWAKFSRGNSCRGDSDKDGVLGTLTCEFGSASKHAPWPIKACYPLDKACRDLGVKENLCGKCVADDSWRGQFYRWGRSIHNLAQVVAKAEQRTPTKVVPTKTIDYTLSWPPFTTEHPLAIMRFGSLHAFHKKTRIQVFSRELRERTENHSC